MESKVTETQEKIQELQIAQQNLQAYAQQKQSFQERELEINSALEELEKTDTAYKIIGNIMIKNSKEDLKLDLESKKEIILVRLKSIEKQEQKLKEKTTEIQQEILKNMDGK